MWIKFFVCLSNTNVTVNHQSVYPLLYCIAAGKVVNGKSDDMQLCGEGKLIKPDACEAGKDRLCMSYWSKHISFCIIDGKDEKTESVTHETTVSTDLVKNMGLGLSCMKK